MPGIVPEEERNCSSHTAETATMQIDPMEKHNLPPNIFLSDTVVSQTHAIPNDPTIADMIYFPDMIKN